MTGGPHDFVYVHTDIPEGMTIREWRRQRAAERERVRAQERAARRARIRGPIDAILARCKSALASKRAGAAISTASGYRPFPPWTDSSDFRKDQPRGGLAS